MSACAPQGQPAAATPAAAEPSAGVETAVVIGPMSSSGALESFVPAVEPIEEGGECNRLQLSGTEGPTTLVLLSFPSASATKRNVSVEFDSAGRRLRYSDLRGNLRREKTGPQTSVLLDFVRRQATATNEWPGRPGQVADGDLAIALQSAHLGYPQRTLDLVTTRCGAP